MDPHDATPKWNIIFLIYAELLEEATSDGTQATDSSSPTGTGDDDINELTEIATLEYLMDLMKELKNIPVSPHYNIFTIENKVFLKDNIAVRDFTTLTVLKPHPTIPGKNKLSTIKRFNTEDFIQKADTIAAAFKKINSYTHHRKNDKILLCTWDHGSAFGIFKKVFKDPFKEKKQQLMFMRRFEILDERKAEINKITNEEIKFHIVKNKSYVSLKDSKKDTQNKSGDLNIMHVKADTPSPQVEILTNHELSDAIEKGFGGKKVEMVLMFNCYMQNMHTGYGLRNSVNIVIAPEGIISVPGYDYAAIASALNENPVMDNISLAKIALDTMEIKFIRKGFAAKFNEHALFAIQLNDYENKFVTPLTDLVNNLKTYLENNLDGRRNITNSRTTCYEMTLPLFYHIIDITNWLQRLSDQTLDSYATDFKYEIFSANCKDAICAEKAGSPKQIYIEEGSFDKTSPPKGYGIYFPGDKLSNSDDSVTRLTYIDAGASNPDFLVQRIQWQTFLDLLYN